MPTIYGNREKCYNCYRPKSSCMCKYIDSFDTNTKFIILMHPKEFKKVKNNTGFFTHRLLKNSELFIGIDFSSNKRINEIMDTYNSFILYPSENAVNLTNIEQKKDLLTNTKPLAVFLIDSTWSCAKKIFNQSENLQKLQHMSFTTQEQSKYSIKQQPEENYLSTIESTLVVLKLLDTLKIEEIEKKNLDNFLNPFFEMIKYQQKLILNPLHNAVRFKKREKIT